ncbi:class I SAM-dependent methyltransferase [Paenibacillus sp. IHBB 3054]|uniref:class I SAM-dependent methyltransferase n=1 Tax=Paenibacillus sp. IHBB 3054 TaxID=3425689 RepID=UPI003F67E3EE
MRDYNKELQDNSRQYAYNFDFDIMHPYMIKSFEPYRVSGNALELGCYQGAFTKRLSTIFDNITCVEASEDAINVAKMSLDDVEAEINFIHDVFEGVKLQEKYDNIFLTHVLEHIDDRIGLLKKINDEWLSDKGVIFIACPNANAASRQIAANMGIIPSCESITKAEEEHGHRVTYTLETLQNDIQQSGLKIIHSSGIFFKALANFQWDQLLRTDIISKEYLDGCYELGKKYPDLCSSIFFVCMKGGNQS